MRAATKTEESGKGHLGFESETPIRQPKAKEGEMKMLWDGGELFRRLLISEVFGLLFLTGEMELVEKVVLAVTKASPAPPPLAFARHRKLTEACGGVPPALEVMGGFLAGKKNTPECWSEVISALRSNGDIMTSLKISYDGLLSNDDKCNSVDIACFMLAHPKHIALAIWDSLDDYRC